MVRILPMRLLNAVTAAALCGQAGALAAQTLPPAAPAAVLPAPATEAATTATVPGPAPAPPPAAPAPAPPQASQWEGAIGPVFGYAPQYSGSQNRSLKVTPGIFLRYGRLSVTNTGGFVTRRADDVARGLGLDLSTSERLKVNLALRVDRGRQESSATALEGLGDVRATVRLKLGATWRLDEHWRTGSSWSADALGRGGGYFGDFTLAYDRRLTPHTVWLHQATLSLAGDRYMQSYYGVSQDQAARTGYRPFEARSGLRDLTLATGFRTELAADWLAIGSLGTTRLLGAAADSPLTTAAHTWDLRFGVAWRF